MSDIDVTKQKNHLFWLWLAYVSLFGFVLFLHNEQCNTTTKIKEQINSNNTVTLVKLVEIEQRQINLEVLLNQMRQDHRDGMLQIIKLAQSQVKNKKGEVEQ